MICPDWLLLLIGGPAACAFAIARAERERKERECKPAPPRP